MIGKKKRNCHPIFLYNLLKEKTDEDHALSMEEILKYMEANDRPASRDTVGRYIQAIYEENKKAVQVTRGRNAGYKLIERLFDDVEIRIILDALYSTNFLNDDYLNKISDKILSTVSVYKREKFAKRIVHYKALKNEDSNSANELGKILQAIEEGKKIRFVYKKWNAKLKLVQQVKNKKYIMNPWMILRSADRCYVYGYDDKKVDGEYQERHYRLDKMFDVEILDEEREGGEKFAGFSQEDYVATHMGMYTGTPEKIKLQIPKPLVGVFKDQFGSSMKVLGKTDGPSILIEFRSVISPPFIGWLLTFDDIEVKKPEVLKEKWAETIRKRYESISNLVPDVPNQVEKEELKNK